MNAPHFGPFLDRRDLTRLLKVSATTIKRWRKKHILPQPLRFGRLVRWRLADLESWQPRGH